jgi:hypothetical protein
MNIATEINKPEVFDGLKKFVFNKKFAKGKKWDLLRKTLKLKENKRAEHLESIRDKIIQVDARTGDGVDGLFKALCPRLH